MATSRHVVSQQEDDDVTTHKEAVPAHDATECKTSSDVISTPDAAVTEQTCTASEPASISHISGPVNFGGPQDVTVNSYVKHQHVTNVGEQHVTKVKNYIIQACPTCNVSSAGEARENEDWPAADDLQSLDTQHVSREHFDTAVDMLDREGSVVLCGPPKSAVVTVTPNVTQCWQCSNYFNDVYYSQCPINGSVDESRAYRGPCLGACFTRTDGADPAVIYRGCTQSQWGLPVPLPEDGCYRWEARAEVWCFCSSGGCNGVKLGQAGNVTLEAHVQQYKENSGDVGQWNDTVLPPHFHSGTGVLQCWQCLSYADGHNYTQCPLHHHVDPTRAYIGNCTGRCFMHTSLDRSGIEVIIRGCTSSQWGLPDPLPEDGCYPWYSEVWCVCSTDGCNGVQLGTPTNVQFDHRVNNHTNRAAMLTHSGPVLVTALIVTMVTRRFR